MFSSSCSGISKHYMRKDVLLIIQYVLNYHVESCTIMAWYGVVSHQQNKRCPQELPRFAAFSLQNSLHVRALACHVFNHRQATTVARGERHSDILHTSCLHTFTALGIDKVPTTKNSQLYYGTQPQRNSVARQHTSIYLNLHRVTAEALRGVVLFFFKTKTKSQPRVGSPSPSPSS